MHLHVEANKRLAANLKALARFERAFSEDLRSVRDDDSLALLAPKAATPSGKRARALWLSTQLWNIALCAVCAATGSVVGLAVDAARLALDALRAVIETSPAPEPLGMRDSQHSQNGDAARRPSQAAACAREVRDSAMS
jgi:hypothetical protein